MDQTLFLVCICIFCPDGFVHKMKPEPTFFLIGGGDGIRTHESLRSSSFQDYRHRPLGDTSNQSWTAFQGAMSRGCNILGIFVNLVIKLIASFGCWLETAVCEMLDLSRNGGLLLVVGNISDSPVAAIIRQHWSQRIFVVYCGWLCSCLQTRPICFRLWAGWMFAVSEHGIKTHWQGNAFPNILARISVPSLTARVACVLGFVSLVASFLVVTATAAVGFWQLLRVLLLFVYAWCSNYRLCTSENQKWFNR